jgi:hypothetical protein
LEGQSVKVWALDLFNVGARRIVSATLKDNTGVLTVPAIIEYVQLREWVEGVILQPRIDDKMEWRWTYSGIYSAKSAYAALS